MSEAQRDLSQPRTAVDMLLDRRSAQRSAAYDLDALRVAGVLRDVDVHFARTMARLAGEHDPRVILGLAVASRAPGAGHACAELAAPEGLVRTEGRRIDVDWPDVDEWCDALRASDAVAEPNADVSWLDRPLVLDGTRLYLTRYWQYQARLLDALRQRTASPRADVDENALRASLERMFGAASDGDLQRKAVAVSVRHSFAVITGGPGTGKTTTVLRLLATLVEQARASRAPVPRIALVAPTGKAAARLAGSIADGLDRLNASDDIKHALPASASTLHRLLGWQPRTPTRFRYDAENPLPLDVVVVDEASMVDLALMAKLVDAVPRGARLVLVGDRDQLASVEAGSILADVCGDIANENASAQPQPAIASAIVRLVRSHRFRDDGGIGALARAINDGDEARVLDVLASSADEVNLVETADDARTVRDVLHLAKQGYRQALGADGPKAALAALDAFRVLTPHRQGATGVTGLNAAIIEGLVREGVLPREARDGRAFAKQPVLVTENDPTLGLFNGDVGVLLAEHGTELRAWFAGADAPRGIAPARLPAHETVFAMTVHKSQGSEFDEVVIALPARPSRVLTRELLYTGVSRARKRVTIVGSREVLLAAIRERVQRASGLREALWGGR